MDKALRNAIIAGLIIISLSAGYYFVIFFPKKEAMQLELQKQEAKNRSDFEKKSKCSEYLEKSEKELEDLKQTDVDMARAGRLRVYYSSKIDACIETYIKNISQTKDGVIINLFTGEIIGNYPELDDYHSKIDELTK